MNIDNLLNLKGKTRYWLAKEINVTYPTIVRLAENKADRVSLSIIHDIVKALNCTYDELLNPVINKVEE